jgi:prepilin-type N-terminal cleavage/methylation domain-containing protein
LYKKGYTVIEMILVITIIGILATLSMPIYKKTVAHYRHSSALRMIATDIRLIQQQSITENQSYGLVFNNIDYMLVHGESSESRELPEGNHIIGTDFEDNSLSFNPSGEPSKGGGTIIVGGDSGNKSYIMITPATGKVKISDEPSESGK